MAELENEQRVEEALARFEASSAASEMVRRYQEAIKVAQEQALRNETGPDCE